MPFYTLSRWNKWLVGVFIVVSTCLFGQVGTAQSTDRSRHVVRNIDFLGEVTFPTGFLFQATQVGGLSGIAYDAARDVYYAISDDRSQIQPARFYTLTIDLDDGALAPGDVTFTAVTTLLDDAGTPFPPLSLDPEGLALAGPDTVLISSEGDANAMPPVAPFLREFRLADGRQLQSLPVDAKFLPAPGVSGIRNNLAFESLAITPNRRFLYTATENALLQDGPAANVGQESLARVIRYDLRTRRPVQEFVYNTDPVAVPPVPVDAFRTNGLVELLATDNTGSFLALERSFSTGVGNTVRLYEIRTQGALDVQDLASLLNGESGTPFAIDPPISKRLLLDVAADLGLTPDNLEGMTFGPRLADGRQTLIIVSDNNFATTQVTQFLTLGLTFDTIPAALPNAETPQTLNDANADSPLRGDADDPAIWLHPTNPAQSLVIATQRDGGLVVFDVQGRVRQVILPTAFSNVRYNNVDLAYNFPLGLRRVDLAVVSDRANDTLVVFAIDPATRRLTDITAPTMPASIFGLDDGEHTAYGLATYRSPHTGKAFAFVSQREGNQLAQLELRDAGAGRVTATNVRQITLPTPTGDPEDSQAEGMVVDRDRGLLYVGIEGEVGVVRYAAEPDGAVTPNVVIPIDAEFLVPDIEGLTIYYGARGTGYLLVSSQGDHTIAAFERRGNNAYVGSFVVGDTNTIDQANETDGADVLNVPLGALYPRGLLVVQDGANDPQVVMQDDEELENISTNFKFVPWERVASAFPEPLRIDPFSANPRGPLPERIDLLLDDIRALSRAGELTRDQGLLLTGTLLGARQLLLHEHLRTAQWVLASFVWQTNHLQRSGSLAEALAASLETGAQGIITTIHQLL